MRILMICPIPLEFTTCRSVFALRDVPDVLGCRSAKGTVSGMDIAALESGPAKARSAAGTVAGIGHFHPDLVLDTGTCGALDRGLIVNAIVFAQSCVEYDISGTGLPHHIIPEMKLPSAMSLLPAKTGDSLVRAAIGIGKDLGFHVRSGTQACGEFFIQSSQIREPLAMVTGALACNWETAGVFVASLRAKVPGLSIRAVSDHGDEDSLKDFKKNARKSSQELYRYIRGLVEAGWISDFRAHWLKLSPGEVEKMPSSVLP